jgi:hypothetical protein
MSSARREAIVVFAPPEDADWGLLSRRERSTLMRNEAQRRITEVVGDLGHAGLAGEVEVLGGSAAQGIPAGAVLIQATPRALKMIRNAASVVAVADADSELTAHKLSA